MGAGLASEQLAAWEELGWLILPGAVPADVVTDLRSWVEELEGWAEAGGPGLHHWEQTDAGPALARSEDFVAHHSGLAAFVSGPLLLGAAGALFGEPAVLFKEKVNYKQPGGAGFAPHQDATAYRFVDHHISCMVPLDPATVDSGCLDVAPGFERGQLPTDEGGRIAPDAAQGLDWRPVEVQPGDLLWFDSYTPHRSGPNLTDRPRRALYLTYNAASAGDLRDRYYADKLAELESTDGTFGGERVRISISDDFLGRPVEAPGA